MDTVQTVATDTAAAVVKEAAAAANTATSPEACVMAQAAAEHMKATNQAMDTATASVLAGV